MNYNEVEILAFKENFSPDVLKKYSGIELLKLLAYPKNPDNNIKEQFKELYEENYNSLKNELENGMTDLVVEVLGLIQILCLHIDKGLGII